MWIFGYGSLVWKADFPYVKKVVGYVKGYERKFYQASIDHRGVPEKPGRVVTLIPSDDPDTRVWGVVYKIHKRDVEFVIRHLDIREMMGYEKLPTEFHPMPNHPLNIFELESNSIPISSAIKSSSSPVYLESSSPSPPASKTEEVENDSDSGRGSFISDEETRSNRGDDGSDTDNESISSDEDDFDVGYESVRDGQPFMVTMYFGAQDNEHYIGPSTLSTMALQIYECSGLSGSNREYLFKLAEAMREICPEALDEHLLQLERSVKSLERSHVCDDEQDGCVLRAL